MAVPGRLRIAAELVPAGLTAADIGCDHGWCALALTERCPRVIAADVSEKSLAKAEKRAKDRQGKPRFETRLGDGLSVLTPGEAEALVITGMSGETIRGILEAGRAVAEAARVLVLQPVQGQEELRRYLEARHWRIDAERLSRDGNHTHVLLRCVPGEESLTEMQAFAGPRLLEDCPPLFIELLNRRLGGLRLAQRHGSGRDQLIEDLSAYLEAHHGL